MDVADSKSYVRLTGVGKLSHTANIIHPGYEAAPVPILKLIIVLNVSVNYYYYACIYTERYA